MRSRAIQGATAEACGAGRVQLQQKVMTTAVVASMLVNVGTVLSVSAMSIAASVSFIGAGFAGVGVLANWIQVPL